MAIYQTVKQHTRCRLSYLRWGVSTPTTSPTRDSTTVQTPRSDSGRNPRTGSFLKRKEKKRVAYKKCCFELAFLIMCLLYAAYRKDGSGMFDGCRWWGKYPSGRMEIWGLEGKERLQASYSLNQIPHGWCPVVFTAHWRPRTSCAEN